MNVNLFLAPGSLSHGRSSLPSPSEIGCDSLGCGVTFMWSRPCRICRFEKIKRKLPSVRWGLSGCVSVLPTSSPSHRPLPGALPVAAPRHSPAAAVSGGGIGDSKAPCSSQVSGQGSGIRERGPVNAGCLHHPAEL